MRKKAFFIAIMLLFMIFPVNSVSGFDDSLKVILFCGHEKENSEFRIGDSGWFEVRVFDLGEPVDPDEAPKVTLYSEDSQSREIPVNKIETGVYTGNFTLLESDLSNDNIFYLGAQATLGKESEFDIDYDEDSTGNAFSVKLKGDDLFVEIEFDGHPIPYIQGSPGEIIDMTIRISDIAGPVNPDTFSLKAGDNDISYTNSKTGEYKASYIISPAIDEDTSIYIYTEAEYNELYNFSTGSIEVDFYAVWYHMLNVTNETCEFELYVSDLEGKMTESVEVSIYYNYDKNETQQWGYTAQGKIYFHLEHDATGSVRIEGTVKDTKNTQNFNGYISINDESEDYNSFSRFWVDRTSETKDIEPGDLITLEYTAYLEYDPLLDQDIYYYIYSYPEFITSGATSTDSNGSFSVSILIPEYANSINLDFEAPLDPGFIYNTDSDDGLYYETAYDWLMVGGGRSIIQNMDIQIHADPLILGGKSKITTTIPDSQKYYSLARVIPYEISFDNQDEMDIEYEWVPWSIEEYWDNRFYLSYDEQNDEFSSEILLPEFLPKNEKYTLIVYFEGQRNLQWNYVHVSPTPKSEIDDQDDDSQPPFDFMGFVILIVVFLCIIIILLILMGSAFKSKGDKGKE
jgi:hypothetical protein